MKMTIKNVPMSALTAFILLFSCVTTPVIACTGISLSGADNGVVYGRSEIDFSDIGEKIIYISLDQKKEQDVENITPGK